MLAEFLLGVPVKVFDGVERDASGAPVHWTTANHGKFGERVVTARKPPVFAQILGAAGLRRRYFGDDMGYLGGEFRHR